jgi:hypothetical protein
MGVAQDAWLDDTLGRETGLTWREGYGDPETIRRIAEKPVVMVFRQTRPNAEGAALTASFDPLLPILKETHLLDFTLRSDLRGPRESDVDIYMRREPGNDAGEGSTIRP